MGTDNELVPAYMPTPGEILLMELVARGWTLDEFAKQIDYPAAVVRQLIHAQKQLTPEIAQRMGKALGTSPELWNNLASDHRLHLPKQPAGAPLSG